MTVMDTPARFKPETTPAMPAQASETNAIPFVGSANNQQAILVKNRVRLPVKIPPAQQMTVFRGGSPKPQTPCNRAGSADYS